MKHVHRSTPYLVLLCLVAQWFVLSHAGAQVRYIEAEVAGGSNDTFALAEDCRQLGNRFIISGMVHPPGNANSDDEWFMFNGAAGACVDISFDITQPLSTGALYQLNVWLFDSSQTMVAAWNTSSASSSASFGIGTYTLPATDTYYIYVTEWSVGPNALSQPGITFTPLSVRGYAVTGATPDPTRNNAGGNQTFGSLYEITVSVSQGNESQFDVFVDCDPATGAIVCSPDPATVCWVSGSPTNVRFQASSKCPGPGIGISIMGGGSGVAAPGGSVFVSAPGPGIASPYTVDDGTGPQTCGTVEVVRTLVMWNGQTSSDVEVCLGTTTCLDVCAPAGSSYVAALSMNCAPPVGIMGFLPPLELDMNDPLFGLTYPINQITGLVSGFQGQAGFNQICFSPPLGLVSVPTEVYLQVLTFLPASLTGLSPKVTLHLMP